METRSKDKKNSSSRIEKNSIENKKPSPSSGSDTSNESGWFAPDFDIVQMNGAIDVNISNIIKKLPCYEGCTCNTSCVAPIYMQQFFENITDYDYFVVDFEKRIIAHPQQRVHYFLDEETVLLGGCSISTSPPASTSSTAAYKQDYKFVTKGSRKQFPWKSQNPPQDGKTDDPFDKLMATQNKNEESK